MIEHFTNITWDSSVNDKDDVNGLQSILTMSATPFFVGTIAPIVPLRGEDKQLLH